MNSKGGSNHNNFHQFGPFRLYPEERLLELRSEPVGLTPKAFDVLVALIRNSGRLVTKEELMKSVWPDSFVTEANLTLHISQLRKALRDSENGQNYIETIPKHGYRFLAPPPDVEAVAPPVAPGADAEGQEPASTGPRRTLFATAVLVAILSCGVAAYFASKPAAELEVKTLAVLPLKRLDGGGLDHLSVGVADAIIMRVSQIRSLTVRPTSAILKYAAANVESLDAARELKVDAVLEGAIQHDKERIRVGVNLLRVRDGVSLWAETFQARLSDIFDVQDEIARQVTERLRYRVSPEERARFARGGTKHPGAYEHYVNGLQQIDRGFGPDESGKAVASFEKALELDPSYALASARLAWAYTMEAYKADTNEDTWYQKAVLALGRAERLDSGLAETCLARGYLAFGYRGGNNTEETVRQFRRAQEANPSLAHHNLGMMYAHIGLEEKALAELNRGLEIDPLGNMPRACLWQGLSYLGSFDQSIAAGQRLGAGSANAESSLMQGRLEAVPATLLARWRNAKTPDHRAYHAVALALQGRFKEAEAFAPDVLEGIRDQAFHHGAVAMAAVYALQGKTRESVEWLNHAVRTGLPSYPLFERHPLLNRIRQEPEFVQFMGEQKMQWERRKHEFQ